MFLGTSHSSMGGWPLSPLGTGYEITDEGLKQDQGKPRHFRHIDSHHGNVRYYDPSPGKRGLIKPTWDYNDKETALSQVPKMFREPEDVRKRLASSTHYHVLDVDRRAPVRLPQQMKDAKLPGHDGGGPVSCLYTLRETAPDRFSAIEAALMRVSPASSGSISLPWRQVSCR